MGVNGSSSPHNTSMGLSMGSVVGFGPGGPVIMETNASNAPSVVAGFRMICTIPGNPKAFHEG